MKKKPRIPRYGKVNPLILAACMAAPVDAEVRAKVNALRHMALIRFAEGNATSKDLTLFDFVIHIGRAIAQVDVGIEVLELSDRAQAVVNAARQRMADEGTDTCQACPGEYDVLQQLVALVDMQMQSMSRGKYEACQRSAIGALQRADLFNPAEATA